MDLASGLLDFFEHGAKRSQERDLLELERKHRLLETPFTHESAEIYAVR